MLRQHFLSCTPLMRLLGILSTRGMITMTGFGLVCGDKVGVAITDQVGSAHFSECLTQHFPVVRIVVPEKGLVQFSLCRVFYR